MTKRRMSRAFGLLALGTLTLSGCTDAAGYDLDRVWDYIPALATLRGTVSYEANELPRLPAAGTVPVASPSGEVISTFTQAQLDSVGRVMSNPLPATPEVLARGEKVYLTQCAVCHGTTGEGNGPVVGPGKYPFAPAVNGGTAAGHSDGYLYAIIRVGRGLMPAYGERITHADRWAVVHYLRQLQGGGAAPSATPTTDTAAQTPGN